MYHIINKCWGKKGQVLLYEQLLDGHETKNEWFSSRRYETAGDESTAF
jgi:hypothetical protein